ncbi:hypothetical protein BN7_6525 [Wickerhamomyces ciferrii]|uniref:Chromatin target of PRMT1 protein C-terminal domain-containing protein n=1 Tax=Wickerhamomyces ciferrii (strain ATCC 14091 / BCRC 22168 / CBS 111 / JCM 3599 / NBRC 0793 / NRRL Y-1031 F-60-10) TaxID=1206466 RepID=K0KZY7_WICCF|nr:uncharacterized protein BN7_6525 [Wickerhamomyces ciferrii]CCH46919.1 hypothetical protein BN7_6525 [Wickerhamomyces ciferrii]
MSNELERSLDELIHGGDEGSSRTKKFQRTSRSTGVAYVGYLDLENNKVAVEKFDGKKAVGERISVEEIRPLNILSIAPRGPRGSRDDRDSRGSRGRDVRGPRRDTRPKKPTLEDLDAELSSYMNGEELPKKEEHTNGDSRNPSRPRRQAKPTVEDLDKELDSYMNNKPFPATGSE